MNTRKASFRLGVVIICFAAGLGMACIADTRPVAPYEPEMMPPYGSRCASDTNSEGRPELMPEQKIKERAYMRKVMKKYEDLIYRQPTVNGFGVVGRVEDDGNRGDDYGIEVYVWEKADQDTLPEADRLPDCLDGVPVRIIERPGFSIHF